jgi:hypothetical protein
MYIFRNRNSTYYSRFYFPSQWVNFGYPKEVRFSLRTKERSVAIDRSLVLLQSARSMVSETTPATGVKEFLSVFNQLYLAINDIDHTKTKAMSPQTNGICERFHKTILNEFYQVTFRKKLYGSMEELQKDLDEWMDYYNNQRTHQGKMCCGRTPIETLEDGKSIWAEKNLAQI